MKTSDRTANRSLPLLRSILPGLALMGALVISSPAQTPEPGPVDAASFVTDTIGLLEVGLKDKAVIAHWERRGWPESVPADAVQRIREARAGLELMARVRALVPSGTEFSRLAEDFENHEIVYDRSRRVRLLRPRGFVQEKLDAEGRRQAFHEHAHELGGWFRRTSYFIFVYDAGQWRSKNEAALGRIAVDAMRRRLELGGLETGELTENRLVQKRSGSEFALFSVVARDPRNELNGIVSAGARVLEEAGLVVVMGFSARLDAANPIVPAARSRLGEMLDSILTVR